jgi:predicted DNA-binding transcriptional regulator YafY
VHGFSHAHGARRTFYLPRVRTARLGTERFTPPEGFSIADYAREGFKGLQADGAPSHEVKLRFEPAAAASAAERPWSRDQRLEGSSDGGLVLSFRTTALFQVAREVLQRGSGVEVLAPPQLREQVARELREAAARYEPPEG